MSRHDDYFREIERLMHSESQKSGTLNSASKNPRNPERLAGGCLLYHLPERANTPQRKVR